MLRPKKKAVTLAEVTTLTNCSNSLYRCYFISIYLSRAGLRIGEALLALSANPSRRLKSLLLVELEKEVRAKIDTSISKEAYNYE
jgi:hypothetical protein